MLLHSDLKLRRWDPNLNVLNTRSVSPIRSYENAIGGGRILSMNPTYIVPGQYLVSCNTPYRALFNLPQTNTYDNTIISNDDAIRNNIEHTVQHIIFNEKERIKQEIVRDALAEIQNELHSNNRIEEISQSGVFQKTRASALNKNQQIIDTIVVDPSKTLTTKKVPNKRYFENVSNEFVGYPVHIKSKSNEKGAKFIDENENYNDENTDKASSLSQAYRSRPKSRDRIVHYINENAGTEDVKSEKSPSKSISKENKSPSKNKEKKSQTVNESKIHKDLKEINTPVKRVSEAYRSRPKSNSKSRQSYVESEEVKVVAPTEVKIDKGKNTQKSKGNNKEPVRKSNLAIEVTPKKNLNSKIYEESEAPFTFSRREKDLNEDINILYDKMRAFEREVINMFQAMKVEIDSKYKNMETKPINTSLKSQTDEKIGKLEDTNDKILSNLNEVFKEINNIKGVNEALEEERKKDLEISK